MPFAIALIALIFILPIGGLIAFVVWRAKKRKAERAGPWSALAQQHGGTFDGDRVFIDKGDHRLVMEVAVVSVMQAAGGPYYPDGGTFTKVTLFVNPQNGPQLATTGPARVHSGELTDMVPGVGALPPFARVVLAPMEATVVLDGSVIDPQPLQQSFHALESIRQAAMRGPLPVAA